MTRIPKEHVTDLIETKIESSGDGVDAWLEQNGEMYMGQWVALSGGTLVAVGESGKAVFTAARAAGVKRPLVLRLTPKGNPFGGW